MRLGPRPYVSSPSVVVIPEFPGKPLQRQCGIACLKLPLMIAACLLALSDGAALIGISVRVQGRAIKATHRQGMAARSK
jgi:hypothetical protein